MILSETDPMTKLQRYQWVDEVADELSQEFFKKYSSGEEEHGCDLGAVTTTKLLDEIEAEALDQLAYVKEMKRRVIEGRPPSVFMQLSREQVSMLEVIHQAAYKSPLAATPSFRAAMVAIHEAITEFNSKTYEQPNS